ncbi:hypothetical protein, partial [Azospirillum sp. SYSU D00513]|uniref:hypothetical protein n=1 Tax=Azospirillum sp. SYSU D00513 TaxID=2812561 RepID=UPI001A95AA2F
LPQLRFTSLAVISLRWDLHPQENAHAGRTKQRRAAVSGSPSIVIPQSIGTTTRLCQTAEPSAEAWIPVMAPDGSRERQ